MNLNNAEFIKSAPDLKSCPELNLPEIALLGRSNVGKSSFINCLTNRKNLAKTSNTPGKTRLINLYNIDNKLILADLPGYGYAKISKETQKKWQKVLEEYLLNRKELVSVIHLIDGRHDVQNNDFQMREWIDYHNIPAITIATKTDTLSNNKVHKSIQTISKQLDSDVIGFSAKTGYGKDSIIKLLKELSEK